MTAPSRDRLLADTHVHLLAGLDDGPPSLEEAVALCRMLVAEGCGCATALAHQNPYYPLNTAERLRAAAAELVTELARRDIPLTLHPTGEVMLTPDLLADWQAGTLLSVGGHGKYLLVEMPYGRFVDVRPIAQALAAEGVRLVIAHAERYPELLHEPGVVDELIAAGCLIQVTAGELADPTCEADERALRAWARRGVIHLLGSDGHRLGGREPRMRAGYEVLARWIGRAAAERVGVHWGAAVLRGEEVSIPAPRPAPRNWFARLFGG